jgi:RHS repeat-associated protein
VNTPRIATNHQQNVLWRWQGEAFGRSHAETDSDGDGVHLHISLRFPGQYHDVESGLHYNVFRVYDPEFGRYLTSDPIGINADVTDPAIRVGNEQVISRIRLSPLQDLNHLYSYAEANPLRLVDVYGLLGADPWDNSVYYPTTNCTCTINCMDDPETIGSTICDVLPSKNPKIKGCEIPLDLPNKACKEMTKHMHCTSVCSSFCSGKTPDNPYPDK